LHQLNFWERLTALPYQTAQAMGINYKSMEKKKRITLVEALELYVPGGWKFTSCHCREQENVTPQ